MKYNKYIKSAAAGLTLMLTSCTVQAVEDWTPLNTQLEIAHLITHVIDFGQTKEIAKNPDKYYEINPLLGKHPNVESVKTYFAFTAIIHPIIAAHLSPRNRLIYQIGTLALSFAAASHNRAIGISINF